MNLDFLNEFKLKNKDLNEKLEFLIPDFLVKKAITIIYANGGSGKSYLSAAISKTLCKDARVKSIVYVDMDNPLNVLNERGFGELILNESKFTYIHRSSLKTSAYELLEMIEGKGVAGS
ncbi:PhoH family protein, partial [Campylobacter jejuni]|nr:PhoH family protein [Campylobacter jejuni]